MKTTLELVREHGTVRTYAHNYTLGVDNSVYEFDKEEMEAFRKACVAEFVKEQKPVAFVINDGFSKQIVINQDDIRTASRFNWEVIPLFTLEVNDGI